MLKYIRIASLLAIILALGATPFLASSCSKKNPRAAHKVLILGIDGMDFHLTQKWMAEGKLPNFSKLTQSGGFLPLISSIPAQSPVAWSNFITGTDPGSHAIFDFIHRDPKTMMPFLSTTSTTSPQTFLPLFKYRIPLGAGKIELLRKGEAFWQVLEKNGINATIMMIPANFPPVDFGGNSLSGMGTPDMMGTYGTFTYFTDNPPDNADSITGGVVSHVFVEGNEVRAELPGPTNIFINEDPPSDSAVEFKVFIDPVRDAAKIEIGDEQIVLQTGEWSPWIEVKFHMAPSVNTYGTVRFYLKQTRPDFKLYVSAVNIDPKNPAMPISTPDAFSADFADVVGLYHTKGMPEDTKALQYGVFTDDEFAKHIEMIYDERKSMYENLLDNWNDGMLFFYFSTLDLNQHMWWRAMDPQSPMWTQELQDKYGDFIQKLYIKFDVLLGETMAKLGPDDTLIVMSDHGFGPFNRKFNVNTWLLQNGYLKLDDPEEQDSVEYLEGVDWTSTRAYNLGISGLYINLKGREKDGIVDEAQYDALVHEIAAKLEEFVDPKTGEKIIRKAYIAKEAFAGKDLEYAPDIILGFRRGYRASDDTALGRFPKEVIEDNKDAWSGDHCGDPFEFPGILLVNRKLPQSESAPFLYDLTVNMLKEYNINKPSYMIGKAIW